MTRIPTMAQLTGFSRRRAAAQFALEKSLRKHASSEAYHRHLEALTREPHLAGSEANERVARMIGRAMNEAGLDVKEYAYDVYLPSLDNEAHVALVTPIRMLLNSQEYILAEDRFSSHEGLAPGWNAYSGSGDVTAEVVYANYGRKEDFETLEEQGITVEGKIVIARYGGNFRGYKAKYAEAYGAVGLIMYSDPADGGYVSGAVYPEGRFMPESGVQRGSLLTLDYIGDPLTPFEPALPLDAPDKVKRLDPDEVGFHTIPVGPLPYGSAKEILQRMKGDVVPSGWQGGLPFTYRLDGGEGLTVRLRVDQPYEFVRATNVLGFLEGSELPDEWIILGAHFDAWNFGTADPNSGTAMLLTLAEMLGDLAAAGHRPRRTIAIAHWDAEEYGVIGSVEWVEQFRQEVHDKVVAYLNADMAVSGPDFSAASSPSLKAVIVEATKAVQHPDTKSSLHRSWLGETEDEDAEPAFGNLGGGSDHVGFYVHVGVPAASVSLGSQVPIYHTSYDNMAWYERFADPEFAYGPAIASLNGVLALRLANAEILPYDVGHYASDLKTHIAGLEASGDEQDMEIDLAALKEAGDRLAAASKAYEQARDARTALGDLTDETMKRVNRSLLSLEKALIHSEGLQGRPWHRSLFGGPDPFSGYAAWMLPGLRYEIEAGSPDGLRRWQAVYAAAMDDLTGRINSLTRLLSEDAEGQQEEDAE